MSLKTKLKDSILGLKGITPEKREGAKTTSTLHFNSSITDEPDILAGQSNLSLKGKKPTTNYLDNLPEKGIRDNVVDLTGTSSINRTV